MTLRHHFKISACSVILCLMLWIAGCDKTDLTHISTSQNLKLIEVYPIKVKEPSGLSLAKDNQSLWTVSDKDGGIYQIDLEGRIISHFQSNHEDLEAITTIDDKHLAYIAERSRKIVIAQKNGKNLQETTIHIPGSDNSGPEALTYDEYNQQFHIMQENPGLLLTLNRQLEEIDRRQLNFAKDYSSISYDSERQHLWVLSDQSQSIYVLDQNHTILESFSMSVKQMEGLAIDFELERIYIISDPLDSLYVFEFTPF